MPKFSKMALAVAKDSGWYTVDMGLGQTYDWGKDEGCDIYNTPCSPENATEFCSALNEIGCSDNHVNRTVCESTVFNETCPINTSTASCKIVQTASTNEYKYGKNSVCLRRQVNQDFVFS